MQGIPMMPRLDILPAAQRTLWPELAEIPRDFVLYGTSEDFELEDPRLMIASLLDLAVDGSRS
jgi:hypothetical protein